MLRDFRDFLLRGNIVELAVAFVMGLAFAAVVNSLVNDLIMPIIAMIFGKQNFNDLTFTINGATFRYGAFITNVIQFVAIAAAVFFFIVKAKASTLSSVSFSLFTISRIASRRFLASSSRAIKALSFTLKDLVAVFSGTFDQTTEPIS